MPTDISPTAASPMPDLASRQLHLLLQQMFGTMGCCGWSWDVRLISERNERSGAEAAWAVSPKTVYTSRLEVFIILQILSANKVFWHCTFTCGSFILNGSYDQAPLASCASRPHPQWQCEQATPPVTVWAGHAPSDSVSRPHPRNSVSRPRPQWQCE